MKTEQRDAIPMAILGIRLDIRHHVKVQSSNILAVSV